MRPRLAISLLLGFPALMGAAAGGAQPGAAAGGGWVLGLAGQTDEQSSESVLATMNWGIRRDTWLSFSAGETRSPAARADVEAQLLVVGLDQRFDLVGFTLEAERWGDSGALTTEDLGGSVYFLREHWRIGFGYGARDIAIPFSYTGPLGNAVERTAEVRGRQFSVDARVAVAARTHLYFSVAEHDYDRDLSLLPRIDRLNLLSASTLTLANSFLKNERRVALEQEIRRAVLTFALTTDESAVDGSSFDTADVALLLPVASRVDLELAVGRGRADLSASGWYGGLTLLIYGR